MLQIYGESGPSTGDFQIRRTSGVGRLQKFIEAQKVVIESPLSSVKPPLGYAGPGLPLCGLALVWWTPRMRCEKHQEVSYDKAEALQTLQRGV